MSNFSKGNELYNTRNYSDAINYYKKALDNDECKCHSYYNAGVCYIKLKQYEKAIEMITKALELYQDSKYFFNLAYCYSMINNLYVTAFGRYHRPSHPLLCYYFL